MGRERACEPGLLGSSPKGLASAAPFSAAFSVLRESSGPSYTCCGEVDAQNLVKNRSEMQT